MSEYNSLQSLIDFTAYPIKDVLHILLQDKTTKENIRFATDAYSTYGDYAETDYITSANVLLLKEYIRPRIHRSIEAQADRTKAMAEVFTPSWVCNQMNNHCDEVWFGRSDVFNRELPDNSWVANMDAVEFPEGLSWKDYVDSTRIEITCGEAPYLVSRYDATSGEIIPIEQRIGILDRKLRVVGENVSGFDEWLKWSVRAYQSSYAFEFQGDSLLLARCNLIYTFVDYMELKWGRVPSKAELRKIAHIVSWNVWQMDGLTGFVPFATRECESKQVSLYDLCGWGGPDSEDDVLEPVPCKIYDWRSDRPILYESVKRGD